MSLRDLTIVILSAIGSFISNILASLLADALKESQQYHKICFVLKRKVFVTFLKFRTETIQTIALIVDVSIRLIDRLSSLGKSLLIVIGSALSVIDLSNRLVILPTSHLLKRYRAQVFSGALATMMCLAFFCFLFLQQAGEDNDGYGSFVPLSGRHRLEELDPGRGEWTYRSNGNELELFHNGRKAFSYGGGYVNLVTFSANSEKDFGEASGPLSVKDITGDGTPDVLIVDDCGCSAGSMTYTLLSLDNEVKKTFSTEQWIGESSWGLEDVNGDGVYEAVGPEFPLAIVEEGFKDLGPGIRVILKYQKGHFVYDSRLMRDKPPSSVEFTSEVESAKKDRGEIAPIQDSYYTSAMSQSAFSFALKLIYSGNGELAHKFITLVFSDQPQDKREYLWSALYTNLTQSPYWHEIAAMNGWAIDQYTFKGPTC